jgi:hypothetical protein
MRTAYQRQQAVLLALRSEVPARRLREGASSMIPILLAFTTGCIFSALLTVAYMDNAARKRRLKSLGRVHTIKQK